MIYDDKQQLRTYGEKDVTAVCLYFRYDEMICVQCGAIRVYIQTRISTHYWLRGRVCITCGCSSLYLRKLEADTVKNYDSWRSRLRRIWEWIFYR